MDGMKANVQRVSGKEVALLPPPPLRTGHESFPSSGSSHCKAPQNAEPVNLTVLTLPPADGLHTT
jgi:hypothetical protein